MRKVCWFMFVLNIDAHCGKLIFPKIQWRPFVLDTSNLSKGLDILRIRSENFG